MRFATIQRILGLLLMIFSFTMLPPMVVSLIYDDASLVAFIKTFFITLAIGVVLWLPVRKMHKELRVRDGEAAVAFSRRHAKVLLPILVLLIGLGIGGGMVAVRPSVATRSPEKPKPLVRVVIAMPETVPLTIRTQGSVAPRRCGTCATPRPAPRHSRRGSPS